MLLYSSRGPLDNKYKHYDTPMTSGRPLRKPRVFMREKSQLLVTLLLLIPPIPIISWFLYAHPCCRAC